MKLVLTIMLFLLLAIDEQHLYRDHGNYKDKGKDEPVKLQEQKAIPTLALVTLPKQMKDIYFEVDYKPPIELELDSDNITSEEIENQKVDNDAEKKKMVLIHMIQPQNVIWFEPPVVCQWDAEHCIWTNDTVFDEEYDKIDSKLQFRASRLWPIGIATLRYSNMPYKNWEMKIGPNGKGVLFTLQGVYINVTILCRNRTVALKEISFPRTHTEFTHIQQYFNRSMTVINLKRIFQEAGIDIFPEFDGHNYIEGGHCIKNWVIEKHLYHAMAFLSKAYSFKFSKWNRKVGTRNIVCQIREQTDKKRESKYKLLYTNPESFTYLKRGEDMEKFSNEPAVGMSYFPDLFTFNMSYGSTEAKRRTFDISYKLTETVFELLQEIKPCSFA